MHFTLRTSYFLLATEYESDTPRISPSLSQANETKTPPPKKTNMTGCPAKDAPDTQWPPLCPSVGAAYLFAILFALTMLAHITQAIMYRKFYSWVISMGAAWQTGAYVSRILSIEHYTNSSLYSVWFILILLAPLWINAYVYMVLGRMVYNFTSTAKILKVKAWRFGLYFVLLDIVAFLIQAAGASMASGDNISQSQIERGLHIYMGGIGFQLFFIICFIYVAYCFHRELNSNPATASDPAPHRLLFVVYTVLGLITIRIIFRLIEYSNGYSAGIPIHEAYQYCLDSLPMFTALVLLNVWHPGRIMPGKESDLPSRKQRKAIGKKNVVGRVGAGNSMPLYQRTGQGSDEALTGRDHADTAYGGPGQDPEYGHTQGYGQTPMLSVAPAYDPAPSPNNRF